LCNRGFKSAVFFQLCLLALLSASGRVFAAPAVTGAEARAFLGGRTGKIVYVNNYDSKMYFVDLADSALVERKIADDVGCQSPMIHPDGTRIVYESGATIWIRDLVANSPSRSLVFARAPRPVDNMEPRWWIDPKTGDEYVIYVTGHMEDFAWPPASSGTYMQKIINKNKPSGAPLLLMPFLMASGRSADGKWGGTSYHSTGMYKFYPDSLQNAFRASNNWLENGSLLACNGSISTSKDPTRENRLMHLTSGGTSMGGKPYDNHKAIIIRGWDDPDPDHPLWWIGPPGDRVNDDGSGNLFWGAPEWSTHEDYFTATGSKDIEGLDSADLYMLRINWQGESRLLRVLHGGGKNIMSHMWVKDGVQPARIRLDKSSLSFTAFKKDSSDPGPDTVRVSNGGDGTLPSLVLGKLPAWLQIAIVDNGTNHPLLIQRVFRDSVKPGDYQAAVRVSFGELADSATYAVAFTYNDPVLTRLKPLPATALLRPGESIRLAASGLDQAGRPMADSTPVAWSLDGDAGGSSLATDGLFQSDSLPYTAWTALGAAHPSGSPAVYCTTTVMVVARLLRIDAAGKPGEVPAGWIGDDAFVSGGGSSRSADSSVSAGAAVDPAPDAVYRSFRTGLPAYSFDSLPDGRYRVRLHFAGAFPPAGGGLAAVMEGRKVLEDYHPPAKPDAGVAADVRTVTVTVSDGNGLQISFQGPDSAFALAGLEIAAVGVPPVNLTSPNGGETFAVGDTVHIRWSAGPTISSCGIQISIDSGATWMPVTRTRSVAPGDPDWEDYPFVVPDSLDGKSVVGDRVFFTVYDYFGVDRDRSNAAIHFTAPIVVRARPEASRLGAALESGGRLRLALPGSGRYRVSLADYRGREAARFDLDGGDRVLSLPGLPRGLYTLTIRGPGGFRSLVLPYVF
jgi:hypothetical protein